MKIAYMVNSLNLHQYPICDELSQFKGIDFCCISTLQDSKPSKYHGDKTIDYYPSYAIFLGDGKEQEKKAQQVFLEADVGLVGGSIGGKYNYIYLERLKKKKLTFFYSERVYKKEPPAYEMPLRAILYFFRHMIYLSKYMLCASAYTAADYKRTGNYLGKAFQWGYFSKFDEYDLDTLMRRKFSTPKTKIVWVARYLNLKHPEAMIALAEYLKKRGCDFEMNMIGRGGQLEAVRSTVKEKQLEDVVHVLGALPNELTRKMMEEANIFAFTSDREEGWGVVLNEAMNAGCACVASHAIGAVPYLIDDEKNGLVFQSGNWEDLCQKTEKLIRNPNLQKQLGMAAYQTIRDTYTPKIAAERFVALSECLLKGESTPFQDGLCSLSAIVPDDWYPSKK